MVVVLKSYSFAVVQISLVNPYENFFPMWEKMLMDIFTALETGAEHLFAHFSEDFILFLLCYRCQMQCLL